MIMVPWARNMIRMVPKMRLSPMAAIPYIVAEKDAVDQELDNQSKTEQLEHYFFLQRSPM